MKEFLVAVAKHVATPAKVVGKGIASNMVKAGATALAMGGAPLSYPSTPSGLGIASSPPKKWCERYKYLCSPKCNSQFHYSMIGLFHFWLLVRGQIVYSCREKTSSTRMFFLNHRNP
jgi:hypothetical protein